MDRSTPSRPSRRERRLEGSGCLAPLADRREASALVVHAEPAGEAGVELRWEATFPAEVRQGSLELPRSGGCPPVFAAADDRFVRPVALGEAAALRFSGASYRTHAHAFEGEVRGQQHGPWLRRGRYNHAVVSDPDGKIYAVGGTSFRHWFAAWSGGGMLASVVMLDTAATASEKDRWPVPR